MLEVIGISAVRLAKRRKRNPNLLKKRIEFAEARKAIGNRKVEKSRKAPIAGAEQKQGTRILDGDIVYGLYDKEGKVRSRVPQKSRPVNELV